jgi:hypothetical protein
MKTNTNHKITELRKWDVLIHLFEREMAITMGTIKKEYDKHTLAVGWALGKGLLLRQAREFAVFISNATDLLD